GERHGGWLASMGRPGRERQEKAEGRREDETRAWSGRRKGSQQRGRHLVTAKMPGRWRSVPNVRRCVVVSCRFMSFQSFHVISVISCRFSRFMSFQSFHVVSVISSH